MHFVNKSNVYLSKQLNLFYFLDMTHSLTVKIVCKEHSLPTKALAIISLLLYPSTNSQTNTMLIKGIQSSRFMQFVDYSYSG